MLRRFFPEMNQLMRAMERDLASPFFRGGIPLDTSASAMFNPAADIHETDKSFIIETELPGVKRDDISMELLDDSTISIRGKLEPTPEKNQGQRQWASERFFGAFQRTFTLPSKVDAEKVSASLKDGILKVELMKIPEPQQRRIPIEVQDEEATKKIE